MIYVKILEWLIEILLMLSGFVGTGQFHCQFEPKLAEAVISGTLRQEPAESVLPGDSSEELHREEYIESVYEGWGSQVMTSVGKVRFPVFLIEFQDVKFEDHMVSLEELERWIFTGEDSVAAYFAESSYGRLHMDGDIYRYTAKGNMADYEKDRSLENLIMEALRYYEDQVDFSQYDVDGNSVMDSLVVSIPSGGDEDFWWGSQHTWQWNSRFKIDDLFIVGYIVYDEQPYPYQKERFIATLEHELGHCMGLPDYYKYDNADDDWEGMHGIAGKERMDDSEGDFCQFSKLQLGWLKKEQVQVMSPDEDRASFLLPPSSEGGCVVVFPRGEEPDFQKEYFVVEYNTPTGLMSDLFGRGGVRVMHVQAEVVKDGYYDYRYSNFSEEYDTSNEGIRVLKLVNDGRGYYHEGDLVTFEKTGGEQGNFGWYTQEGKIEDPGFLIRIGQVDENGCMEIEVERYFLNP